jgi:hypothetical protein
MSMVSRGHVCSAVSQSPHPPLPHLFSTYHTLFVFTLSLSLQVTPTRPCPPLPWVSVLTLIIGTPMYIPALWN